MSGPDDLKVEECPNLEGHIKTQFLKKNEEFTKLGNCSNQIIFFLFSIYSIKSQNKGKNLL